MEVALTLRGEGIEFEREISESTAISIMQLAIADGDDEGSADEVGREPGRGPVSPDRLPEDFFVRLSSKQEAMLRVLVGAEEPLTSTELRRRMAEEHDVETSGGRALAGILAGFTRKYGDDFEVVAVDWGDGEGLYQLNPDRPEYVEAIEERLTG